MFVVGSDQLLSPGLVRERMLQSGVWMHRRGRPHLWAMAAMPKVIYPRAASSLRKAWRADAIHGHTNRYRSSRGMMLPPSPCQSGASDGYLSSGSTSLSRTRGDGRRWGRVPALISLVRCSRFRSRETCVVQVVRGLQV